MTTEDQMLKPEFPVTGLTEDEQAYQEQLKAYNEYKETVPKIDGAIFIKSFSEQLIREEVMMEKPDGSTYRLIDDYKEDQREYERHVASRRTFPYPVSKEQDGKELREGKDFVLVFDSCDKGSYCSCNVRSYGCPDSNFIAIPIEPDDWNLTDKELTKMGMEQTSAFNEPETPLRTKDELVKKGEAGYEWLNYIKRFPKLDELWNQLPNVPNVWLSQQIDIFAGKYPSNLQPVKDEIELQKAAKKYAMAGMGIWDVHCIKEYLAFINGAKWQLSSPPEPASKEQEGDAVGFAEWILINNYRKINKEILWGRGFENHNYTTEQLYKKFKDEK